MITLINDNELNVESKHSCIIFIIELSVGYGNTYLPVLRG